jgi:hypothetical protein
MNKFNHLLQFVQPLFDEKETAGKEKPIIEGILKARATIERSCPQNDGQIDPTLS